MESVCLALNLLLGSVKTVSLDYESRLPAAPVLSMLAVTFTYSFEIQAEEELTISGLFNTALRTM